MKKFKIIVRGGYGFSNFGDDALMLTIFQQLKKVEKYEDIAFLCKKSNYLASLLPGVSIIDFGNVKAEEIHTNLLVYGGGTQFYSFPKKNVISKIKDYLFNDPSLIWILLKKKLAAINDGGNVIENKFAIADVANHIALIGVGLGPFDTLDKSVELKTERLFKRADFVSVRDSFSRGKCIDWEIQDYNVYPDICFGYDSQIIENNINVAKDVKTIGVVVRDWKHDDKGSAYYEKLIDEVSELRENGYKVKFISFDLESDKEWIRRLTKLNEDFVTWDPIALSIDDFLLTLDKFDLFITARYHGAVFSALLNKPFIGIEVEQKLRMISNVFEGGAECWEKPFLKGHLKEKVDRINKNYVSYCSVTSTKKTKLKGDVGILFDSFTNYYTKIKL